MLFRTFPWVPGTHPTEEGGPLFVPQLAQGFGRHDNPTRYGAIYASYSAVSPVAELLKDLRTVEVQEEDLQMEGAVAAMAVFDDTELEGLSDLDDPRTLVARGLRPSGVATRDRKRTQAIASQLFDDGHPGFRWWSTIEASWVNVTLFAERAVQALVLQREPEPLTLDHPSVRAAADVVGVDLAA